MSDLETCPFDYIPHDCDHHELPEDVLKLQELKRQESQAFANNDHFAVNDVRVKIVMIERAYHRRLDDERQSEWGKMPPHP